MSSSTNGHYHSKDKGYAVADLQQRYDDNFVVTPEYRQALPDLQNGENNSPKVEIQHVGIHNFKIPMHVHRREGGTQLIHCSVTGSVSLEAYKKGINMSRIIRTFYEYEDEELTPDLLQNIARSYLEKLDSSSARIAIAFDYPIRVPSLRSGLSGYQYYPVVFETVIEADGNLRHFMHLDFEYSSACPCSYELGIHASSTRGVAVVPHSQRSVAKVSINYNKLIWIEDLVEICRSALVTETQVMVKREDEQAFAEMNAATLKFVEDAVRLLYTELDEDSRIQDFRIFANHMESLHSHDAISVVVKGVQGGYSAHIDPFGYGGM
ncbi:MAG: GTP cyclohydrolase FolE2 [Chloroflexota bacterium]